MGATSKDKRILPAKLVGKKKRGSKYPERMGAKIKPAATDCVCFPIPGSGQNGFWAYIANVATLVSGIPASGGPWAPAFYPNGTVVWVNVGGLV